MKCIFVFANRSLFSQGIKNLLDAEPELTVVGWESDPGQAIQRIKETKPDAVFHIIKDTSESSVLTSESLMKLGIKTKFVELSLDDANVYIYQGEQLIITGISDLVSMI